MTCTSIPILWYSVFDYEYEKETPEEDLESKTVAEKAEYWRYFMMNPNLYKLGIKNECFS